MVQATNPVGRRTAVKQYLTAQETAVRLGISYQQVLRRTRAGLLEVKWVLEDRKGYPARRTWKYGYPIYQFPPALPGKLVDAGYIAKIVGVSRRSVNYWANAGKILGFKNLAGEWRFVASEAYRIREERRKLRRSRRKGRRKIHRYM
ncbi:MAG: hypothetical protein ACHQUB_03660 [Candidatus Saccharimonadia bacterium]